MSPYHIPVLLQESIAGLNITPGGSYVDATFGSGGHSREILKNLPEGKLVAFDQDEEAAGNLFDDPRLVFAGHNFRYIRNFLHYHGFDRVDGILADLGVSWHDFDDAGRGFSFRNEGPLDMRMNRHSGKTAADVINQYSEAQLAAVFREYGELPDPVRLASSVVAYRAENSMVTTGELVKAVSRFIPRATEKKYLAQLFQALRMEINDEINALKELLEASLSILKPGGRLVIIAYHSLEDRLVKNFMKSGNFEGNQQKDLFGNISSPFVLINKKVIVPGIRELEDNPRSRSAKLRIAEKK